MTMINSGLKGLNSHFIHNNNALFSLLIKRIKTTISRHRVNLRAALGHWSPTRVT